MVDTDSKAETLAISYLSERGFVVVRRDVVVDVQIQLGLASTGGTIDRAECERLSKGLANVGRRNQSTENCGASIQHTASICATQAVQDPPRDE